MKLKHILLTTDLSEESMRAFAPAAQLAKDNGGRITLLHVVQDVHIAPHGAPLAPPISDPDVFGLVESAKKRLAEERSLLDAEIEVTCKVIQADEIGEAVADYANQNQVDLIALSTHGRTGFRRLILGSVAQAVLHHAKVPVLCFPQAE